MSTTHGASSQAQAHWSAPAVIPPRAQAASAISLPEDQRRLWIAAWNDMRACAQRHGFDGVAPVASTFGDGRTPAPAVHVAGPNASAALSACPFGTDGLDMQKLPAAIAIAERE
jgi:hypothetical protein